MSASDKESNISEEEPNMRGKFAGLVESIARRIAERIPREIGRERGERGIYPTDIETLFGQEGDTINLYPSASEGSCRNRVVIMSLVDKRYAKGRGHLSFSAALDVLVQHMTGVCAGRTTEAIVIADSFDPNALNKWRATIEQIIVQQHLAIEIYVISDGDGMLVLG